MLNKATLIGRLGKDAEIIGYGDTQRLAKLSIATSEGYKDKATGEWKEKAEWHKVSVFGNIVDYVDKYFQKGKLVYIEGKITTRSYEQDGVTKYSTEIVASSVKLLDKHETNEYSQNTPQAENSTYAAAELQSSENLEDLPF